MNYNKKNINILSSIITIIILLIIAKITVLNNIKQTDYNMNQTNIKNINNTENEMVNKTKNDVNNHTKEDNIDKNNIGNWNIEIPKLNINATIKEGTSRDILENNIGHYSETSIYEGNIALLGNNNNTKNNFFSNLKELGYGDKVIYKINNKEQIYKVEKNIIISLETVNEVITGEKTNTIMLLTYVINMPNYMRCVIAKI